MPPRLEMLQRLGTINLCLRPAATPKTPFMPLIQTANLSQRERKRKAKQDPYRWAQAQQRKNANLKRRGELQAERDALLGDPIWGNTTPFLESLESAGQAATATTTPTTAPMTAEEEESSASGAVVVAAAATARSHYITDAEIDEVARHAYALTRPVAGAVSSQTEDGGSEAELLQRHAARHERAVEALRRITDLGNASKKDRFHFNVRRIVDSLGRHATDGAVAPRPPPVRPGTVERAPRAGPDTGSAEVQIGILTAKIRNLAQALALNRGYKDIHNKRNLRLMLHRRQKLLRYMERKEKGSGRWTNMIEKLGLTPAMWKGQIELR